MPATTDALTIDPGGVTMTVDILNQYAVSQTTYTAAGGASTHSLPLAISAPTTFHLTKPGAYSVSAKINGVEVGPFSIAAGDGVPARLPVTVSPAKFVAVAGNPAAATFIANASVAHALNSTFSDVEAENALNALGAKVNAILALLITQSLMAAS